MSENNQINKQQDITKEDQDAMTKEEFEQYRQKHLVCGDCRYCQFSCKNEGKIYLSKICSDFKWW